MPLGSALSLGFPLGSCRLPSPDAPHLRHDPSQYKDATYAFVWAAYLMTTDKRCVSVLLLQRQLGIRHYETGWMLLHKLRRAMMNFTREPLHGEVEVDEIWIGGPQPEIRENYQLYKSSRRRDVPQIQQNLQKPNFVRIRP